MATTSLWAIEGRIDYLIRYVENPEKTTSSDEFNGLWHVVGYATRDDKTEQKLFVNGLNCLPEIAVEEMIITKKQFHKCDGRIAYHGYQSFRPGEVTPETAHRIGMRLAWEMWGGDYQVVVSTHLDKAHIHNHFAVNSVSFVNGKKYDRTNAEYRRMREVSDRLCREYGLSIIESPQNRKSNRVVYWAEKAGQPTRYNLLRQAIDEAILRSMTLTLFYLAMERLGYEVKTNTQHLAFRPHGAERFVRVKMLGLEYEFASIRSRILRQMVPKIPIKSTKEITFRRFRGLFKTKKKIGGFRGLYLHYCYRMGVLPKNNPRKPIHPLLAEDLRFLDRLIAQMALLCKNKINTAEQLRDFLARKQDELQKMTTTRNQLNTILRRKRPPENIDELRQQRNLLSANLIVLRKELKTALSIEIQTEKMRDTLYNIQKSIAERQKSKKSLKKNRDKTFKLSL